MKNNNERRAKRVFNLIIVDESGSMSVIREQAFTGMNETLKTIQNLQKKYSDTEQLVTLMTFDSEHTKWHYDGTPASKVHKIGWRSYDPCAATPLYDAIGKGISKVNAQVSDGDNVLVTIITDGEENSSREWTLKMVRNLIEKLKKQNWTFTLIGTDNLDVKSMAGSFSIDSHMAFVQSAVGTKMMFERENRCRERYVQRVMENTANEIGDSFFKED